MWYFTTGIALRCPAWQCHCICFVVLLARSVQIHVPATAYSLREYDCGAARVYACMPDEVRRECPLTCVLLCIPASLLYPFSIVQQLMKYCQHREVCPVP